MFAVLLGQQAPRFIGTRASEAAALRLGLREAREGQEVILYNIRANEFDFYYVNNGRLEVN